VRAHQPGEPGQALNLVNGPTIADAVIAPEGRITRLMKPVTHQPSTGGGDLPGDDLSPPLADRTDPLI